MRSLFKTPVQGQKDFWKLPAGVEQSLQRKTTVTVNGLFLMGGAGLEPATPACKVLLVLRTEESRGITMRHRGAQNGRWWSCLVGLFRPQIRPEADG
jgi:hypothetical protein